MLYDTKLNDFELDQLDFFLSMVEDRLSLIQNSINRVQEWTESETRSKLLTMYERQQASAMLLQVQLENAKSDLKEMQTSNQ